MNLSDMVPLREDIEHARAKDSEFRQVWDGSAFARDVATQIVAYRAKHGLTQTQFAALTALTQPRVANLESGEEPPTLKTLAKVSAATDLQFRVDVAGGNATLVAA